MCSILPRGIHDYDDILRQIAAGCYSFAKITTAAGRIFPLIGISEQHLAAILNVAARHDIGLLMSGSRVVGPRTKQVGLHPVLRNVACLTSTGRLGSDNYPEVRGVTITKDKIKELGPDSPHTSDLSIVLIDPRARPHGDRAAIALDLALTCSALQLSFPIRIFSELDGYAFSSVAEYVTFHCDHLFRRDLPSGVRYSDDQLAQAARELFAYFPPPGNNKHWTDRTELTRNEYASSQKFHTRVDIFSRISTSHTPWHRWLFENIAAPAVATVIDIGCGPGYLWTRHGVLIPESWTIILCDLSLAMVVESVAAISGKVKQTPSGCVLDATALPFDDSICDVVVADSVLYHVKNLASTLRECQRVLRPGGIFHAATVGSRHLAELVALLRAFDQNPELDVVPTGFLLDHAAAVLSPLFSAIEVRRFPDELIFPDVSILMTYLQTLNIRAHFADRWDALEAFLARSFANGKKLSVSSDVGLLLAKRGA